MSENAKRVFYNKVLGEPYDAVVKEATADEWRRQIIVPRREGDPEAYLRGQVPPGVRFLTAGQDSRSSQLHYCVWGWGLARLLTGATVLRRWLIDWDCIQRVEKSNVLTADELNVFDALIYGRFYPTTYSDAQFDVRECGHDTGWNPTAVYQYSTLFENRAIPVKGGSDSSLSTTPPWREGHRPKYRVNDEEIELGRPLILFNTYLLKLEWHSTFSKRVEIAEYANGADLPATGKREVPLLSLPGDVDEEWLKQSSSEALGYGRRKGEQIWTHKYANHFGDCNVYAYGLALKINPFQAETTAEEAERNRELQEAAEKRARLARLQKTQEKDFIAGGDRRDPWISER